MDKEIEKKIDDYLAEAKVLTLSTVDGNEPRARPLGLHMLTDAGVCFGIGDFKAVYRQMQANPRVEITACTGGRWMRYHGRAEFLDRPDLAEKALEGAPQLRSVYNDETGYKMMIFHLVDAKVEFIDMMTVSNSFPIACTIEPS